MIAVRCDRCKCEARAAAQLQSRWERTDRPLDVVVPDGWHTLDCREHRMASLPHPRVVTLCGECMQAFSERFMEQPR